MGIKKAKVMLCPVPNPTLVYTDDYTTEMTKKMSRAWELARDSNKKAQTRQIIQQTAMLDHIHSRKENVCLCSC